MKLRKGDTVEVVTGKDKGKQGEVDQVFPKSNKIIVHGVNTASKHSSRSRANEQGGIIEKDLPFDASNVMFVHGGRTVASVTNERRWHQGAYRPSEWRRSLMAETAEIPRLKVRYNDEIAAALKEGLGIENVMDVPRLREDCHQHGCRRAAGQPR